MYLNTSVSAALCRVHVVTTGWDGWLVHPCWITSDGATANTPDLEELPRQAVDSRQVSIDCPPSADIPTPARVLPRAGGFQYEARGSHHATGHGSPGRILPGTLTNSLFLQKAAAMNQPLQVPPGTKVRLKDFDPARVEGVAGKKEAVKELKANSRRLAELGYRLYAENRRALLLVLQGMDTAGKDGTIRHVMRGFNPQGCRVTSFKTAQRRGTRPRLPLADRRGRCRGKGNIGIFNRSHYEDVLVVRVHNLVPEEDLAEALRADQRLRAAAGRGRHDDRQVLPPHQQGRAARAAPGETGRPAQALEVQPRRRRGAEATGTTTWRPTRRPSRGAARSRAVAHRSGQSQVVPQPAGQQDPLRRTLQEMDPQFPPAEKGLEKIVLK